MTKQKSFLKKMATMSALAALLGLAIPAMTPAMADGGDHGGWGDHRGYDHRGYDHHDEHHGYGGDGYYARGYDGPGYGGGYWAPVRYGYDDDDAPAGYYYQPAYPMPYLPSISFDFPIR